MIQTNVKILKELFLILPRDSRGTKARGTLEKSCFWDGMNLGRCFFFLSFFLVFFLIFCQFPHRQKKNLELLIWQGD
jgi:hypothetical protein